MLAFFRMHWFDIGIFLAIPVIGYIFIAKLSTIHLLLWVSLVTLFMHQFEEYRYPGYFPGIVNTALFSSNQPDRYPFNPNTAFVINLGVGWLFYFLAALFAEQMIWLGIATILVSLGNFFAHCFLFNFKGKSYYNPGMTTSIILFLPLTIFFFYFIITNNLASVVDWSLGLILGVILNVVGILKMIDWLKDENTPYIWPKRFLLPNLKN